jgi:hypothetical protein
VGASNILGPLVWLAGSFAGLVVLSLAGIGLITVCAPGGDGPPAFLLQGTPFPRQGGTDGEPAPDPTATPRTVLAAASPAQAAPSATPTRPAATPTRRAPGPATQQPTAAAPNRRSGDDDDRESAADFSGRWTVTDTVTSGANSGQTFTFDVVIIQVGSYISGGNTGLFLNGRVEGETARVDYVQPALGLSGEFEWTMQPSGTATGTFTSSLPNRGSSRLTRR